MKVQVNIDPTLAEKEVIIRSPTQDEQIHRLCELLTQFDTTLSLYDEQHCLHLVDMYRIERFYGWNKKVYADVADKCYEVRLRLYEVEQLVEALDFVRISKQEIINLHEVDHFDFTLANTIVIILRSQVRCSVSRRYVAHIKEHLERLVCK